MLHQSAGFPEDSCYNTGMKENMKKTIVFLCAAMLLLTACTGEKQNTAEQGSPAPAERAVPEIAEETVIATVTKEPDASLPTQAPDGGQDDPAGPEDVKDEPQSRYVFQPKVCSV